MNCIPAWVDSDVSETNFNSKRHIKTGFSPRPSRANNTFVVKLVIYFLLLMSQRQGFEKMSSNSF